MCATMGSVKVSAKADYAVRAAVELAAAAPGDHVKGERIATAQEIPLKFLENILIDLRQAGIVLSQRGPDGGYWLDRPAEEVSVADVVAGRLPPGLEALAGEPESWVTR